MARKDGYYVRRCLRGHVDDYRHLVKRYEGVLLGHLAGRLGCMDAAEEVAQESLVRAYFKLSELKKPSSYFSWLISIANNVAKEFLRDKKKFNTMAKLPEEGKMYPVSREDDYELEKMIANLPKSQREVLLLRYYGGLSCLEVAQKLGIPLGTVTKNLSRAYKNLRELLNKPIADEGLGKQEENLL